MTAQPAATGGAAEPGAAGAAARRALIIANDTYDHASLSQLRAPEADARALAEVLGDPEIGGFDVTVVQNEASYEVQARIDDLFADSRPDDLVLLHFSGHGLKSDSGELFFAARNTRPDRLGSTSVAADFVQRCMRAARARTIVLFLDCCYGGAFGEGVAVRAAGPVRVVDSFPAGRLGGGRGRAVISASSAMEYAFEGTTLTADHEPQPSVFTSAVVEGLRSGEADRDEDGLVSLGELYDYVFDRVREQNPHQTPGRDVEMSGEVYLARSGRRRIRPVPISDALRTALANPDPTYRRGAVLELRDRLANPDLGVALGALEALQEIARSDTKSVADDAKVVIDAAAPAVSSTTVDFGDVPAEANVAIERELTMRGLPIARQVRVEAEPPLSALVAGDTVTVTFSPTGRPYAGSVTITGPTGSVVVSVRAGVASRWATPEPAVGEPAAGPAVDQPSGKPAGGGPAPPEPVATEPPIAGPRMAERRLTPAQPAVAPVVETAVGAGAKPVGDTVAAPQERAPGKPEPSQHTASGSTLGAWPVWGLLIGAVLVFASMGTWVDNQEAMVTFSTLLGPGSRALLAVVAGVLLLAPRVRRDVAAGFLLGTTVAAGIGILMAMGVPIGLNGVGNVRFGWWLAFVGQGLIALTGVVALAVEAWRSPLPRGPIAWRDPATYAVLVLAAGCALLLVSYAGQITEDPAAYWVAMFYIWAIATVVVALVALAARPSQAGRLMLLSWAVAIVGLALSEWVILTSRSAESYGMPVLLTAGLLLALASGFVGRRAQPADPAETSN